MNNDPFRRPVDPADIFYDEANQCVAPNDPLPIGGHSSAPIHTFDTRYGTFSRYRLTLGATLPIVRHLSVEPYLVRQVDWVPAGVVTNALGLLVIATF